MFQHILVFQAFCSLDASLSTCCLYGGLTARPTIFLIARASPDRPIAGIPGSAHSQAIYIKLPIHRHRAALLVWLERLHDMQRAKQSLRV